MRIPFQVAVAVVGVVACTVLLEAVRCEVAGSRIRHFLEPVAGAGIVVVESQVVDLPFLPGAAVEVQAAAGDGLEVSAFVVSIGSIVGGGRAPGAADGLGAGAGRLHPVEVIVGEADYTVWGDFDSENTILAYRLKRL